MVTGGFVCLGLQEGLETGAGHVAFHVDVERLRHPTPMFWARDWREGPPGPCFGTWWAEPPGRTSRDRMARATRMHDWG